MIKAVMFDYGDTLVVRRKKGERLLHIALEGSFEVFKRINPEVDHSKYVENDTKVFESYARKERSLDRDIPDQTKYEKLAETLLPGLSAREQREIAAEANAAFWKIIGEEHKLRMGAKPALATLRRLGVRMAVVSNHHNGKALRDHLRYLGIFRYFSEIVVSSELTYRKPDPRIFRRCAKDLAVRPQEVVFVGDSLANDIRGANAAGMFSVLVTEARPRRAPQGPVTAAPDFVIRDLRNVPGILEDLE